MRRRIYLASSWKNALTVTGLASALRSHGHDVFDFTDADNQASGLDNFVFGPKQWTEEGKSREKMEYKQFLEWPLAQRAFRSDRAGLDWADTVILVLPSGRSSHLEAGYGVGQGKDLFIYGDLPLGDFDAMYGFARAVFHSDELPKLLALLSDLPIAKMENQCAMTNGRM